MLAFVGIDISKEKVDLGWLRDVVTRKKKNKVLPNTVKGHKETAQWLLKNIKTEAENIVIVMEPTNVYHEGIMYFLREQGFKVFLVNPAKARKFAESIDLIHKTDKSCISRQ